MSDTKPLIWFQVDRNSTYRITPVALKKVTQTRVYFDRSKPSRGYVPTWAEKRGPWGAYFPTWAEARAFTIERAQERVRRHADGLSRAKFELDEALAIPETEPDSTDAT